MSVEQTNSVQNRTFKETFNGPVRFEIPFFQRGYAWEKRQWDQLFVDLEEQVLDELASGSSLDQVEHFFGPVVVLEKAHGEPQLKQFVVIDGQQRITTVYLLLAIIREHIGQKKHDSGDAATYYTQLGKYLTNDVISPDDYKKIKIFSSKGDRLPTYRTVFGTEANPNSPSLQSDQQLYIPGRNQVDEFKKYAVKKLKGNYSSVPKLWDLSQALLNSLKIVWIPLDETKDDPQAIFESLNDKGMPLTASELLCSYLFRPIINAKEDHEHLHNNLWLAAERLLEDDGRFEEYLRHLFSIGETKMVGKHRKVYVHFKLKNRQMTSAQAKAHLAEIHGSATLYRTIKDPTAHPHSDEKINRLLISIGNTRMDSSTPFIPALLRGAASGSLPAEKAQVLLRETLVLLVRRKMTELATTQYDVMFPQLLSNIVGEPDLIKAIHDHFKKHALWISDQEFEEAVYANTAYRRNDLAFSRMLLVELDKAFQVYGQLPDYSTVNSIEHMIPQTLDADWKTYLGSDANDEHLPAVVNTIGNLCLLSGPANSSAGQNPFEAKRAGYSSVTALARQMKDYKSPWNIAAVRERSRQLAKEAVKIWAWSGG